MKMRPIFLLSDVVLMGLISSFTTLASIIIIAIVNARIKSVQTKLDKSIEQMDGHMTKFLAITESSSKAKGKLEGQQEQKAKMAPIIEEKVKAAKDAGKVEGFEQANGQKNGEENSNQ